MELGNFSISLSVKDIEASKAFYEKFGFRSFMGNALQKWLIMKNGEHVIKEFTALRADDVSRINESPALASGASICC